MTYVPIEESDKMPMGAIIMWYGTASEVPVGWAICDGNNGTPDLRGCVPVGVNTSDADFDAVGKTGGAKTHTLTVNEIPSHGHSLGDEITYNSGTNLTSDLHKTTGSSGNTGNTGGGQAHNNLQPYLAVHFIMKL